MVTPDWEQKVLCEAPASLTEKQGAHRVECVKIPYRRTEKEKN